MSIPRLWRIKRNFEPNSTHKITKKPEEIKEYILAIRKDQPDSRGDLSDANLVGFALRPDRTPESKFRRRVFQPSGNFLFPDFIGFVGIEDFEANHT
jgi:hypothetical protein